jgi:hypothetical protein
VDWDERDDKLLSRLLKEELGILNDLRDSRASWICKSEIQISS